MNSLRYALGILARACAWIAVGFVVVAFCVLFTHFFTVLWNDVF